jgi:Rieske Fe-S protein
MGVPFYKKADQICLERPSKLQSEHLIWVDTRLRAARSAWHADQLRRRCPRSKWVARRLAWSSSCLNILRDRKICDWILYWQAGSDLITAGFSPWEEIYSPARKIHKNLGEYVSENITPLKNFAEYLSADEIASVEGLRPGEGRLVRNGLQKVAACRDQKGQLHLHSASCTHLGCVVHWNSLEQCWDCPCHGSQFAPDGTALNGPAVSALADVEKPARHEAAE